MNHSARKLAIALAVSIVATAGTAYAATSDTQSEAMPQAAPVTGQSPGLAIPPAPDPNAPMPERATPGTPPSSSMPAPSAATPSAASGTAASTTPAAGAAQNTQARKIFDQLDTNHDGVLSFEEFSRATFETK